MTGYRNPESIRAPTAADDQLINRDIDGVP
jgi:hypothetical protein